MKQFIVETWQSFVKPINYIEQIFVLWSVISRETNVIKILIQILSIHLSLKI